MKITKLVGAIAVTAAMLFAPAASYAAVSPSTVTITVTPATGAASGDTTYTFVVTNNSGTGISDVIFQWPTGVSAYVSHTKPAGWTMTNNSAAKEDDFYCASYCFANGTSVTFTLTMTATSAVTATDWKAWVAANGSGDFINATNPAPTPTPTPSVTPTPTPSPTPAPSSTTIALDMYLASFQTAMVRFAGLVVIVFTITWVIRLVADLLHGRK